MAPDIDIMIQLINRVILLGTVLARVDRHLPGQPILIFVKFLELLNTGNCYDGVVLDIVKTLFVLIHVLMDFLIADWVTH